MATVLSLTRDNIIYAALQKLGVLEQGGTPAADEISEAATSLNIIMKSFDSATWFKWLIKSEPLAISTVSGIEYYTLDSDIKWVESATVTERDATEILDEGAFPTHVKWDVTGDMDDTAGTYVIYTHSAGAGTLTQVNADQANNMTANVWYLYSYTISGTSGSPAATITTGVAKSAVTLDVTTNGLHSVVFKSSTGAATGDFVISGTSSTAGDTFKLDDTSLRALTTPDYTLGPITMGEYAQINAKTRPGIPINFTVSTDKATPVMYLWPTPNAVLAVKYWARREVDVFDSSTDTFDLPSEWYRPIVYMLAADLAPEYGKDAQRYHQLSMQFTQVAMQLQQDPLQGRVENIPEPRENPEIATKEQDQEIGQAALTNRLQQTRR
jgi:hypothetical protein